MLSTTLVPTMEVGAWYLQLPAGRASGREEGGSLPGLLASTAPQWPSSVPKGLGLE